MESHTTKQLSQPSAAKLFDLIGKEFTEKLHPLIFARNGQHQAACGEALSAERSAAVFVIGTAVWWRGIRPCWGYETPLPWGHEPMVYQLGTLGGSDTKGF